MSYVTIRSNFCTNSCRYNTITEIKRIKLAICYSHCLSRDIMTKASSNIGIMVLNTNSSVVCKAPFEVPACEFYERSALFHGGDMVRVILGPSKDETGNKERVVPRTVLCYYSKVSEEKLRLFRNKSDGDSVDANGQDHNNAVMDLNEWDTETFDMAIQWMYTGNVIIDIAKPKPFDAIRLYIQFFKIAKALELKGSYSNVERNLKAELAAASEKEYDEDDEDEDDEDEDDEDEDDKSPVISPALKEILKDAFAYPLDRWIRELLASFLLKPYVKHLLCSNTDATKAKEFKKLFKEIEGLELDVLRLVSGSLSSLSMGKVDGEGYSTSTMWCPLTELRFDTGSMYKVGQSVKKAKSGDT
ncbi:uncharacterized protein Bfra_000791 [Botrytis fragariae]|uniref:BTB domain-containing protein n=1 Tax=Botrytis fragariae TaxID=1964551 RepID=A0A8H6ENH4_9HELO|nr:uncharacterized protein Bfra_000791 [Botrytis fragariae]KAF5878624.1 hypothetical protein Bfra_000791 [Botrytis fragariae]